MIKQYTMALGCILLAVGIMGILTGGHNHELMIFGINATHNMVHLLSGVLGIFAAWKGTSASRTFCLVFGAIYGLVTILGLIGVPSVVQMLNINTADNFLHLAISASALYFGFTTRVATA